ncbi:MAG: adenylyltransferase/cytidyltransferase family protein [Candidatus Nealsonbacteria bacterium]
MKNKTQKIILDYKKLSKIIKAHKTLNQRIVCTIGSWDMLHIGHVRYLSSAKDHGDILIVGVDSDRAIKLYKKNPLRPIIPQGERMEMLSYQSFVDYISLIDDVDKSGHWQMNLIKAIKPDVFVTSLGEAYPTEQRKQIAKFCNHLKVLKRQAKKTSTTKIIEKTVKQRLEHLLKNFKP